MKKIIAWLLSICILSGFCTVPAGADADDYFADTDRPVEIAVFGGSIVGSQGKDNWSNQVAEYIGERYTGGKGANLTKYNVGGIGSVVGLSRMVQLVNTTGEESSFAPDVVMIEYAVNDAAYIESFVADDTVTASTEIKFVDGKLNIYDPAAETYTFDYYNTSANPKRRFTGHYTVTYNEEAVLAAEKRIEEMIRLAKSLPSDPAIFLVNVGLGLTLGPEHPDYPNFPGFVNSIANRYDALAQRLGIGYIDVEKETWRYIEDTIEKGLSEGTYSSREEAKTAIQLELYGDQSNIHPMLPGCNLYAQIINQAIDADPEKYLTPTAVAGYLDTASYSTDTHIIPYTAGTLTGDGWSPVTPGDPVFKYGIATSVPGDSISFDFSGALLGIYTAGGTYTYEIFDRDEDRVIYTSSDSAAGIYVLDEKSQIGTSGEYLQAGKNYTVTLTHSGKTQEPLVVTGMMANMAQPAAGYPSWAEFNLDYYIPYSQQYFDFTNKSTASDPSIETYFADMEDISYNADVIDIARADEREALRLTSKNVSGDKAKALTIDLNPVDGKIINIEFDIRYNSSQVVQSEFYVSDDIENRIFRVIMGNPASPCINSSANRFSTAVDNWWAENCNDGEYHTVRLMLTPNGASHTVRLWIDGTEGDTTFVVDHNQLTQLNFWVTKSDMEIYLDDIRIYDEAQDLNDDISNLGQVTLDQTAAVEELRRRADHVQKTFGSYSVLANYEALLAAEETLAGLEALAGNIGFGIADVYSPFPGKDQIFDFNSDYTVDQVTVNGEILEKGVDYFVNPGRLKLAGSLFGQTGTYAISVRFTDGEVFYDAPYTAKVISMDVIDIPVNSTDYILEFSPQNVKTNDDGAPNDGIWRYSQTGWAGWSSYGDVTPYHLRMNLTAANGNYFDQDTSGAAVSDKWMQFKGLPGGTYTVSYANYALAAARQPMIDIAVRGKSGNKVSGYDPYAATKGFGTVGQFTFRGDGTDYIRISPSVTQPPEKNDKTAILCVYGIQLTPYAYDDETIDLYFEYGDVDVLAEINSAPDAAALETVVERYQSLIGVNAGILADMQGVYEALGSGGPYTDLEAFQAAFDQAVENLCESKAIEPVQTLEDLRLVNGNLYLRNQKNFNLSNSGADWVQRPGYLYYEIADIERVAKLSVSLDMKCSQPNPEFMLGANVSAFPVTDAYPGISEGEAFAKMADYADRYTPSFTTRISIPTDTSTSVDLGAVLAEAKAAGAGSISIKLYNAGQQQMNVNNVSLTALYDTTAAAEVTAAETYTAEKVSFVNCVADEKGYIGSISVKQNNPDYTGARKLIAAVYKNGAVTDVVTRDIPADGMVAVNQFVAYMPEAVRLFVWDSESGMSPLAKPMHIAAPEVRDDGEYASAWYYADGTVEYIEK